MADRLLEYVALLRIDLRRSGWMAAEGSRVTAAPSGTCRLRLAEPERAPPELRDLEPRPAYRLVGAGGYASDDAADGNPADVEGMMPYDALVDATLPHRVILHSRETEHGTGFSKSTIPRTPLGDLLALDAASGQGLAPALARRGAVLGCGRPGTVTVVCGMVPRHSERSSRTKRTVRPPHAPACNC